VANLLLSLLVLVTLHDDSKEQIVRSTIAQEVYSRLPTALAAISLFFSVAAVLVTIGLMRTMYRDDVLRQITNDVMRSAAW